MADQTVKIEREGLATVARALAEALWFEEKKKNPKASDADFMALVATCSLALSAQMNPENAHSWAEKYFKK